MNFVTKLNGENWTTIDSIDISDQNLTMILLHVKRALRKIEIRHSLYFKTRIILDYKKLNKMSWFEKGWFLQYAISSFSHMFVYSCFLASVLGKIL